MICSFEALDMSDMSRENTTMQIEIVTKWVCVLVWWDRAISGMMRKAPAVKATRKRVMTSARPAVFWYDFFRLDSILEADA